MSTDADFDPVASRFEGEIYGSSKGFVRLGVLREELSSAIPELADGGLRVLDAGGGAGHAALLLAQLGNEVVLADPSQELLRKAENAFEEKGLSEFVTILHSSIQELEKQTSDKFDLVACHAVLEWLADPKAVLGQLANFLKHDGHLSLMFYNRNAALLKRVFKGEFTVALREQEEGFSPRGWGAGAIPLAEETVRGWLGELGLSVRAKAGIRIFHDHLPSDMRTTERLGDLLELEKEMRRQEPFASLGQHIHLVCEWA